MAKVCGISYDPARDVSICHVNGERRLGGVLFTNFNRWSIFIHTASWTPYWVNRDMMWVVFDYPFNQLGVKRIFGMVPGDNLRARKFNEHAGFRYVNSIEGVGPGDVPLMVMCLDHDDCKFLSIKPRSLQPNYKSNGGMNGRHS